MKYETIKKLERLLANADTRLSAVAFNLNVIDRHITGSTLDQIIKSACKEADNEASAVKGGINDILQAQLLIKEMLADEGKHKVYLWLVKDGESIDFETEPFVWPFAELPKGGDKIDLLNVIADFAEIPEGMKGHDYYIMQYSFFEKQGDNKYIQCLKLKAD
jgi:hypothetical protein